MPAPERDGARGALARKGLVGAARDASRSLVRRITSAYAWHRAFHSRRSFLFEGRRYRYLVHPYNSTWNSERTVEIPIVWEMVRQAGDRRVLEVGNVLAHYFPVRHDRVDKYERGPGVQNVDVVEYRAEPYDLIVSISTLEHVGWDEPEKDPDKVLRALENLRTLTSPGGRIAVTIPLAYNPQIDAHLKEERLVFSRSLYLRRVSRDNRWEQAGWDEVKDVQFDRPFRRINAVMLGIIDVPPDPRSPSRAQPGP